MNDNTTQPELVKAIDQLRSMICGLGAIVFLLSFAFGGFVWKQIRNVSSVAVARQTQVLQMKNNLDKLTSVANDLANYSNGRPDLMVIFHNHNIDIKSHSSDVPKH